MKNITLAGEFVKNLLGWDWHPCGAAFPTHKKNISEQQTLEVSQALSNICLLLTQS